MVGNEGAEGISAKETLNLFQINTDQTIRVSSQHVINIKITFSDYSKVLVFTDELLAAEDGWIESAANLFGFMNSPTGLLRQRSKQLQHQEAQEREGAEARGPPCQGLATDYTAEQQDYRSQSLLDVLIQNVGLSVIMNVDGKNKELVYAYIEGVKCQMQMVDSILTG